MLTPAQKAYLQLKRDTEERIQYLNRELEHVRRRLARTCTHPEELHVPFSWEHDDGYGRQTLVEGVRCSLCGARKHWRNSSYWTKE